MNKFLETIMNFINENTTLLIIICVFLIFVLIGYLIDNSIKTRKLEKQMINGDTPDYNEEPINEPVVESVEEKPTIDPNTEINLDFRTPEEIANEAKEESVVVEEKPAIDPNTEINLDFRTPEEIANENAMELPEVPDLSEPEVSVTPVEPISNEITVDPAINDLLLRDFSNNGISTVDENPAVEEEVTINPIENVVPIDNILENENVVSPIEPEVSVEPIVTEIKPEEPKEDSVYKNDKKLSDIFKKKSTTEEKPNLEKTSDYTNELDKILKKINDSSSKDSTLDETQDFTNMF